MMNKRDLLADLKFCDRATQGPWRHEWNPDCSEVYAPGVDTPIILVGHDPYDADFVVQAREGWPHAIERALAEKERIEFALEIVKKAEKTAQKVGSFDARTVLQILWSLEKVLGDEETCAGRQSASAKDY